MSDELFSVDVNVYDFDNSKILCKKIFINLFVFLNSLSYHIAKKVSGTTTKQIYMRLLVRFDTQ